MVGVFAHGTIYRIIAIKCVRYYAKYGCSFDLPRAVPATPLATFDGTGQFFSSANLDDNKFPPFIKYSLDTCRDIDDLTSGYNLVVTMNVSVKHFVIPEIILGFSVFV